VSSGAGSGVTAMHIFAIATGSGTPTIGGGVQLRSAAVAYSQTPAPRSRRPAGSPRSSGPAPSASASARA
jgi:hypothetical protein